LPAPILLTGAILKAVTVAFVRVGVIYHCEQTTGRLDDELHRVGAETVRFHLHRGDSVPGAESFDRIVTLGGEMGAYEDDRHAWMAAEKTWLAGLVEKDVPVLGICLGSQLLAAALGGSAFRAKHPEADVIDLELTADGDADPVMNTLGSRVFSLHQDTFDLPPGSTLLAHSKLYPQAFRAGSALAVQFHPDADADLAKRWGKEDWSVLGQAGIDYDEYSSRLDEAEPALDANSRAFFRAWLERG